MNLLSIPEFAYKFHDSLVEEIGNKFPVENRPSTDGGDSTKLMYISFLNSLGPLFLTLGFLREAAPESIKADTLKLFEDDYRDKFPTKFELYKKIKIGELFTNDPPFNTIEVLRDGERLGGLVGQSFKYALEVGNGLDPAIAARNITLAFGPILDELTNRVRPSIKKKSGGIWSFFKK